MNQITQGYFSPALLIISLEICLTLIVLLHAHLQVINYNCVKYYQYQLFHSGGVALTRHLDRQTDRPTDRQTDRVIYIYPKQVCLQEYKHMLMN